MTGFLHGVSDRRTFLKKLAATGALTIVGASSDLLSRPMTAWAAPGNGNDKVIVKVFLRGGADGMSMIAPHGDDEYYNRRPNLALQSDRYTDLDGFFGLHESFTPLYSHFAEGRLAVVHAAGLPSPNYSHFDAMPLVDTAFGTHGWLQRTLQAGGLDPRFTGLSIGSRTLAALKGPSTTMVVESVEKLATRGMTLATARPAIEAMYRTTGPLLQRAAVADALVSIDDLGMVMPSDPGAYPGNYLAGTFRQAASLIKADLGVRGVALDVGGWDTHANQKGEFAGLGSLLAGALAAFQQDLGTSADRVVVVVISEFGRTAAENGGGGTEHGYGNAILVMGEPLVAAGGGQVHVAGGWPGLGIDKLNDERDLLVTTDFRTVLSEVIDRHLGIDPGAVFAGHSAPYVGLLSDAPPVNADGDTDQSGAVDQADVELVVNDLVGNPTAGYFPAAADLDFDGDTDLLDALKLAQQIAD